MGAISAGLGIMSSISDFNGKQRLANDQRTQSIQQMNATFANYEMQRQQAFDAHVESIVEARMKSDNALGTVQTAVGEAMGDGTTARALMRNAESKGATTVANMDENMRRKNNEIDVNKEAVRTSTESYLQSIKDPSLIGLGMSITSTVAGGISGMQDAEANAKIKGVEFDKDKYLWGDLYTAPKPKPKKKIARYNDNG